MRARGESQVTSLINLTSKFPFRLRSHKKVRKIEYIFHFFSTFFSHLRNINFHLITFLRKVERQDDFSICVFPEHREFVRLCREAEAEAKRTGQKTTYSWRGTHGVMAANLPPMTVPGLELRLMNALEKVQHKTIPETLVKKI